MHALLLALLLQVPAGKLVLPVLLLVPAGLLVLPLLLLVLGMCLLASCRRLVRISTTSDIYCALLLDSTGSLWLLACPVSTSASFNARCH
jgi:hypothetical protein